MNLKRYTVDEVINGNYYQMPKFIFEGEFKNLSNNARVLYSLLRELHVLSMRNDWINDCNEVYLLDSNELFENKLYLKANERKQYLAELEKADLIEIQKQEDKPDLLFVKNYIKGEI